MSQLRARIIPLAGPNAWTTLPIEGARAFAIDTAGLDPGMSGAVIPNPNAAGSLLNSGRNLIARVLTAGGESVFFLSDARVYDFHEPIVRAEVMVDDPSSTIVLTYPAILPVLALYGDAEVSRI